MGLALLAVERLPETRPVILPLVIASTVVFELIGPLETLRQLTAALEIGQDYYDFRATQRQRQTSTMFAGHTIRAYSTKTYRSSRRTSSSSTYFPISRRNCSSAR